LAITRALLHLNSYYPSKDRAMKFALVSLLSFCSLLAHADTKEDKVRTLFEVQGVVASYQASIDEGRTQAKVDTQKILDQMLGQLNPGKEFQERINRAAEKFTRTLLTDRTAEDIVKVIVQYYSPNFTEAEIDKLIEFYSSPVGKKDAEISKDVMHKVADHFKESNEQIRTKAVNEFVRDLQLIAKECKCQKKQ
jgi:hypothetical protein